MLIATLKEASLLVKMRLLKLTDIQQQLQAIALLFLDKEILMCL